MAEARNAVSVSYLKFHSVNFEATEEGIILRIPKSLYTPHLLRRAAVKHLHRFRNSLLNLFWPAPPMAVVTIMVLFCAFVMNQPLESWWRSGPVANFMWSSDSTLLSTVCPGFLCSRLPVPIRVGYLAAIAAILFILMLMFLQRLYLRFLLHYRSWMYERRPSLLTKLWGLQLKVIFLAGRATMMFSFQRALPRQFVPSIDDTIKKYLASVRPLLEDKEFGELEASATKFRTSSATKLNTLLHLKSWWATNYVSDWWIKYVYLRGRSSLLIGSNYYGNSFAWFRPTTSQAARAGVYCSLALRFFRKIDRESLTPMLIRGTVPLCMDQYNYLFSTTRIPGKECDTLQHYDSSDSRNIIVISDGRYYSVPITRARPDGRITDLTSGEFQCIMEDILSESANDLSSPEARIAALTTMERTEWATVREEHFSYHLNRVSLATLERAVFILNLDQNTPETVQERSPLLFVGNGTDRWCDKSVSYVVFANGSAGVHAEHSWGDAPVTAHSMEEIMLNEANPETYDSDGNASDYVTAKASHGSVRVDQLHWAVTPALAEVIDKASVDARAAISDLELVVFPLEEYGKGFMKKMGVSPDGYIQMALQLAYFRDRGNKFGLTYESAMTRLFRGGRTETIRSVSDASCAFVEAMNDRAFNTDEKLAELLQAATNTHQNTSRNAMSGFGVDRHLFALYVMSMGVGEEAPEFLQSALGMKWKLSTSQLPQRQTTIKVNIPDGAPKCHYGSPSGGFGPVADDGYGVSYMIVDDDHTFFHVSSKRSAKETSSARFVANLKQAFTDIKDMLEGAQAAKAKLEGAGAGASH